MPKQRRCKAWAFCMQVGGDIPALRYSAGGVLRGFSGDNFNQNGGRLNARASCVGSCT